MEGCRYSEDDLLPLSALQHMLFCERQCALIHLEWAWAENRLTAEGRAMHERVHEAEDELRDGVRIARGLRIRSLRLGLIGQADVVEFCTRDGSQKKERRLKNTTPYPVEYKRGRPKADACDEVQLCAQALCLEEMLGVPVAEGALFYGRPRRRHAVAFTPELRALTEKTAGRLHELLRTGRTPPAGYEKKCESCSLLQLCLPRVARPVNFYLQSVIGDM